MSLGLWLFVTVVYTMMTVTIGWAMGYDYAKTLWQKRVDRLAEVAAEQAALVYELKREQGMTLAELVSEIDERAK